MDYRGGTLRSSAFRNSDLCLTLGLQRRFKLRSSLGVTTLGPVKQRDYATHLSNYLKRDTNRGMHSLGKVLFITSGFLILYFNLLHKQGSEFWFLL